MPRPRLLAALACVLLLNSCVGPDDALPAADGVFAEALALVPGGVEVHITDWAGLAEARGGGTPESIDDQRELVVNLSTSGAIPVLSYDVVNYVQHEQTWGWDLADLAWEAAFLGGDGAPTHVLAFGDSFDVGNLIPLLEERGYAAREVEGVTLYEHELDLNAEWLVGDGGPTAPLSVANMAVLTDDNAIIVSGESGEIEAALARPDASTDEALVRTLGHLGDPLIAGAAPGGEALCARMVNQQRLTPEIEQDLAPYRGSQYEVFAYGYDVATEDIGARVVLRYGDASAAQADVPAREATAERPTVGGDQVFTVDDITVADEHMVIALGPDEDGRLGLSQAFLQGDLLLGYC